MTAVLFLTVVLAWGLTWIAIHFQLGDVPVEVSITWRFALAAGLLFAWLLVRGQLSRLCWRDHLLCAAQGACLFCINFLCLYNASGHIASGVVAVIFTSSTLMNALQARLWFGQSMSLRFVLGALVGMAGVALLFAGGTGGDAASGQGALGVLLALAGTACFSSGNMLGIRLQRRGLGVMDSIPWAMAYGALLLFVWSLWRGHPLAPSTEPSYLWALAYLVVPGTLIGFTAYLTLVRRIGAGRAAFATVLSPVIALTASSWLEGLSLTPLALLGVLAALLGNAIALWPRELDWGRLALKRASA